MGNCKNADSTGGDGGKYQYPSEEIGKGISLVGPDLCGESRSSEAKAAAGEDLRTAATSREEGVVGFTRRGTVSFPFSPTYLIPCLPERAVVPLSPGAVVPLQR